MEKCVSTAAIIFFSVLAMTLIIALRYLAVSGCFALATRLRRPGLYAGMGRQMRRELGWSLLSALVFGIPAGVVAWGWEHQGWTRIYTDVHEWPLWYLPLSVFIYLFAHDSWFYWTHRLMHRPALFRIAHAVHHESRPPTAWAAMSFHPWEALTGAVVIPALVFFIPIHVAGLGMVLAVMTILGVTNHIGWELFPRWIVHGPLGRWLITATHHQEHHTIYRGNYGLYFRFWDKLCGTDKGLGRWPDAALPAGTAATRR
jgi:Delta7-sterol 5-desaturase